MKQIIHGLQLLIILQKKLSPLKIAVYSKQHECVKVILEFEVKYNDS